MNWKHLLKSTTKREREGGPAHSLPPHRSLRAARGRAEDQTTSSRQPYTQSTKVENLRMGQVLRTARWQVQKAKYSSNSGCPVSVY